MKAAVVERFGSPEVVEIRKAPKPAPADGEVLIRIHATTVDIVDVRCRALRVPKGMGLFVRFSLGFFKPRIPVLGVHMAGQIEAIGKDVTSFKPGDRVFGSSNFGFGCHAEYRTLPANGALAVIPENLTYAQAAVLGFGAETAITFFRCGKLKASEHILINGASGAVGTAAIQIAKHRGAEVTAVCSAANIELVKSLGADHVIDYIREDFAQNGKTYDVVMDNVGNAPFTRIGHMLGKTGRLMMVIPPSMGQFILGIFRKQVVTGEEDGGAKTITANTMQEIADLTESGALYPVIDRSYAFEEIAKAHAYVDSGRKKGNVVIAVTPEGNCPDPADRALPASGSAYKSPFDDNSADLLAATGERLRNPDQLRRSPVAHPAPSGVSNAGTQLAAG